MLKILFVTPYVPSSVRIRPMALIRELNRLGHEITLACLIQPTWESRYLNEVTPFCKDVHAFEIKRREAIFRTVRSLPTLTPLSVAYCHSKAFSFRVQTLVDENKYDLIHTEFIRAAPFTASLKKTPKVFDAVDSMSLANRRSLFSVDVSPKQRLISLLEWLKMHRFEQHMMNQYDRIIFSSRVDGQNMGALQKPVAILPNGVDTDYFSYNDTTRPAATIVFLGKMSYYVNVASVLWFYRKVFPLVRAQVPNVIFRIVGREPVDEVKKLCKDPAIEVTGTVADVRPHLVNATIAICPMVSGSGIQNKMLEAMAVGTPCIATTLATQALHVQAEREVFIADEPESFASAILRLLACPAKQREISAMGRAYVEKNHIWSKIGMDLKNIYSSEIQRFKTQQLD